MCYPCTTRFTPKVRLPRLPRILLLLDIRPPSPAVLISLAATSSGSLVDYNLCLLSLSSSKFLYLGVVDGLGFIN